ncbi:MAG: hypothetical protein QOD06_1938 [Candidatus Binatota bacterium]|jgi:hypothetical protein|nr:hypothetical protein [Candidatus Binatota bacterium]
MLTAEQLGHLRHFDNLSRQLPNDWSSMQGKGVGQDDFGGYRFQLAYMAYALALAHVHWLPAAPGVFKGTFERLIEKILLPEVWMYWRDTSRGGAIFNQHLGDRLHEEWNPVVRDNIMYSAYVQSMALLYHYLFDDDRYAKPSALSFRHWSFFWGGEEKHFDYDENSLNDHIYWQMVENGHLGIACEPNCIFQICNQPAILGFRMHDLVTGGSTAEEVTRGYEQAWLQFGRLDAGGHYNMMLLADTKTVLPNEGKTPWVDAWCGTLMNMWNREFVRANYPRQVRELLDRGRDGTMSVRSTSPREVMGQRVVADSCDFGWVATWASEMGDSETLDGLLAHADRHMAPTWGDGGLYYPRNDAETDAQGNRTLVEPLTGNALLGYARLNVPDGLWRLYNEPWDRSHFTEPALAAVARDIDVSEAFFDRAKRTLTFTIRRREDVAGSGIISLRNVDESASWKLAPGFVLSRDGGVLSLRCPPGGFQTIVATLR